MAISRARLLAASAATLLLTAAAVAQQSQQNQQTPESLLPPGFDEPVAPAPAPSGPAVPPGTMVQPLPLPDVSPSPTPSPTASPTPIDPAKLAEYEMPAFARRSLDVVGAAGTTEGGLPANAFGTADGQYLETLMRRLSAPLPSRWLSIALRRALMSRVDTPANVNGADFAAERAWLLLRMGESVAARSVVQAVDTTNVTPKLRQVTMQAALATADPAGLCPLTSAALTGAPEPGWVVAQAMCAALSAEPGGARPYIQQIRRKRVASGIDLQLAEKVAGAGANSRQAITIEWDPVVQLTAWRFGLATATGVKIPDSLYETVGAQVTGWRALAPAIPLADRAAPAERAAAMGILSNLALVDLYGALDAADDTPAALGATAADLRVAYVGGDTAARISAIEQLWNAATTPGARYARMVLTARAAARLRPASDVKQADGLVASILSAGLDRTAQRWREFVPEGGDAWAMLTLADPDAQDRLASGAVSGFSGSGDATRKRQLFFAGVAGLGRLAPDDIQSAAESLDVRIGAENAWTRALDRAVRDRQPATVILLSAIGMQTRSWGGVPPAALYRIIAALRAVGLSGEARMIAVEAIARA
ncbi:hypothetical protein M0208_00635 [Sphingomonas sp. SUN019]|uniref:hypothetical protein n=1 Tax=Sphingomonas sp. SUN019 TaxID=2937788 RepID=UPI002164C998|nr:hypothetical protein [Sphingomonas sp. SUN019]UVO49101.1 hypothetical protein M0208_00635 [Sphingomonas sp. SUN019]